MSKSTARRSNALDHYGEILTVRCQHTLGRNSGADTRMQHAGTSPTTETYWNSKPMGNFSSGQSLIHLLDIPDVCANMIYRLHHQGLEIVWLMHANCFTGSTFCHTSAGLAQSQQDWVRVIVRRHASCARALTTTAHNKPHISDYSHRRSQSKQSRWCLQRESQQSLSFAKRRKKVRVYLE